MNAQLAGVLIAAYFLGNLSPGWLCARLFGGCDVRTQGSGATGATNTARALGKKWFYVVLALDIAKAVLAVSLPIILLGKTAPLEYGTACAMAVVAGHIKPALLGFRGGKGVGPFIGAWLGAGLYFWPVPLTLLAPCFAGLFFLPLRKGAFMSALCGLLAQPVSLWIITRNLPATLFAVLAASFILLAHWSNFKTAFAKKQTNV